MGDHIGGGYAAAIDRSVVENESINGVVFMREMCQQMGVQWCDKCV